MDTIAEIDAFFAGKPVQWALFDALLNAICRAYPDTQLRVMKTCVSFDDPKPYCYVSFPKKESQAGLIVTISLREPMAHPRFLMIVPISQTRYTVHIRLQDAAEIDGELLELIALSHR